MEIKLDLSTEQLAYLDKDLTVLLKNLTDEQKIEILKGYMIDKFKELERVDSWGRTELSDFGKEVIQGLQKKISDSITEDVLSDENLKKELNDITEKVKENISDCMCLAIVDYITNNLFFNKQSISEIAFRQMSSDLERLHQVINSIRR